jgi:hypothetical protein
LIFLDHTQRWATVGRTSLDEWSARRRDLYLTTHDTHNRQISIPPGGIRTHERWAHLLRSWVRLPPGAWIFICCECLVLSGRGLCDELVTRPEESYRLWCVVVCDLETSRIGVPYTYDISSLRFNLDIRCTVNGQFQIPGAFFPVDRASNRTELQTDSRVCLFLFCTCFGQPCAHHQEN